MKLRRITIAMSSLLMVVCASAADRVNIVSEHQIAKTWTPAPDAPRVGVGYPTTAADKTADVCVSIGFMIEKDGSTSNFSQVKSWSSATPDDEPTPEQLQPFVQSAAAVVSTWKFVPATDKPRPIYTSSSFVFEGSQSPGPDAIRARCRIDNLSAFVNKLNSRKEKRGDLERARQESNRQQTPLLKGPGNY